MLRGAACARARKRRQAASSSGQARLWPVARFVAVGLDSARNRTPGEWHTPAYDPRSRVRTRPFAVAVSLLSLLAGGCGGSNEGGAKIPSPDTLTIAIEHEACDVTSSSAEKIDTNGDGKPDIVRVMSGGREVCRMVDLNHDNKPDSYLYFDAAGNLRRRESDFDRDGRIDEIAYFSGGTVTRKDRETNLDGKLDTWDFYEGGKIHHRLRDSDGDGKPDQWWTWPNPDKIECAVIASDHNGDGKPDPNDVIDVCAMAAAPEAGPPPAAPGAASSASASEGADAGVTLAASMPNTSAPPPARSDAGAVTSTSTESSASKKAAGTPKKETK
jgi:hypothetical protein